METSAQTRLTQKYMLHMHACNTSTAAWPIDNVLPNESVQRRNNAARAYRQ